MADKGASVFMRLRNKSVESGRSYQLCMQLFLSGRVPSQSRKIIVP